MNNKELQAVIKDCIYKVIAGDMDVNTASVVAKLSNVMLKSAIADVAMSKDNNFFSAPQVAAAETTTQAIMPPYLPSTKQSASTAINKESRTHDNKPKAGKYDDTPVWMTDENGLEIDGYATSLVNGNIRFRDSHGHIRIIDKSNKSIKFELV